MKQIVIKYFEGKPLSDQEVLEFIQYYLEKVVKRPFTGQQLTGILMLLRQGTFQLQSAMEETCREFKSLQLYKIFSPQGQLLAYRIVTIE